MDSNFIFERMMEYIINHDFTNAKLLIMSDYNPIYGIPILKR